MGEAQLIRRFRRGDHEAFDQPLQARQVCVYRPGCRLTGSPD